VAVRTVVLDANVYVSALAFGGKPKRAFQLGITRRVHVAISDPIRTEVLRTLRDKFRWSEERLADAGRLIGTAAATVVPTVTLQVVERDPDDDRVLECAVTAKADVIVTGDLDLLSLGEYEGIRIAQVADFLDQMGASDPEP
jgi:putative PIN family toxin of toxin-antitoxin system